MRRRSVKRAEQVPGAIMLAPNPWADEVKRDARVQVLAVARDTRQAVFQHVLEWLG